MPGPKPDVGPGPWHVEGAGGVHMDGSRDAYVVVDAAGRHICRPCTDLSDARLIAAAPDLLEAAKAAVTRMRADCLNMCGGAPSDEICGQIACPVLADIQRLEAAVAKAEGRDAGERDTD